jgi:hypothetical protein
LRVIPDEDLSPVPVRAVDAQELRSLFVLAHESLLLGDVRVVALDAFEKDNPVHHKDEPDGSGPSPYGAVVVRHPPTGLDNKQPPGP